MSGAKSMSEQLKEYKERLTTEEVVDIMCEDETPAVAEEKKNPWAKAEEKQGKRRKRKKTKSRKKSQMMMLDTKTLPDDISVDDVDQCFNIENSPLNKNHIGLFSLLFGDVVSIQRAIEYAQYPGMASSALTKETLPKEVVANRGEKSKEVTNYWAYVGYVVIEKIKQTPGLYEELMEDKPIINVKVNKTKTFMGHAKAVVQLPNSGMYTGVVREVVKTMRETMDMTTEEQVEALEECLHRLKFDKGLSVFAGINVQTDLM